MLERAEAGDVLLHPAFHSPTDAFGPVTKALGPIPEATIPNRDGACRHLPGMRVPSLALASTAHREVNLSVLPGRTLVYCYPRTGVPDEDPPAGWDDVPGARGCTPQACGFRDHHAELRALGADVYGLVLRTPATNRKSSLVFICRSNCSATRRSR